MELPDSTDFTKKKKHINTQQLQDILIGFARAALPIRSPWLRPSSSPLIVAVASESPRPSLGAEHRGHRE